MKLKFFHLLLIFFSAIDFLDAQPTQKIYFSVGHSGDLDIYRINPDGLGSEKIVAWPGTNESQPRISPDGTQLAFVSDSSGKNELYIVNSDGSCPHRISDNYDNQGIHSGVSWFPNGQYLTFAASISSYEIFIYKIKNDGTERQVLLDNPGLNYHSAIDPVEGRYLAYMYDPGTWNPTATFFKRDLETGSEIVLISGALDKGKGPAKWSPDATRLTNSMRISGLSLPEDIYTFPTGGSALTDITGGNSTDLYISPCFSPDGSKIVCAHGTFDNPYELYTMNDDGSDRKLIFDTAGATIWAPEWADVNISSIYDDPIDCSYLEVFPNPTEEKLNIRYKKPLNEGIISIYDSRSLMIDRQKISGVETNVDMSGCEKGLYFLKIELGKLIFTRKIMKK